MYDLAPLSQTTKCYGKKGGEERKGEERRGGIVAHVIPLVLNAQL